MKLSKKINSIIVGVDGGGTKTEALVSDLSLNILGQGLSGPSNPRNVDMLTAVENISSSVSAALKSVSGIPKYIVIGLPAIKEEYSSGTANFKKELFKRGVFKKVSRNNVHIVSDQEIAFCSGTDERDGILAIAGTGAVVRGWKSKKDIKVSGWGYFSDEGSAFWVGIRAYQAITRAFDGRGKKTEITRNAKKVFKFKNAIELNRIVYSDFKNVIPALSIAVDSSAKIGDSVAMEILKDGAKELALGVNLITDKFKFKKEFPVVIVGGMFNSVIFKNTFQASVKDKNARFVSPSVAPAIGALKIARRK
ncbi:MAG: BadF/BadG/BcrA/BcrD ATPase family protein [Candidatus Pacebacteria bacterium]|nr:BadF/BadG/BcrA/BcrD ATPase family protein [Candidatus Paceibacterota bacterium]